jgi:glycogen debranching enzyme
MMADAVSFGREICGDLAAAEAREWLVTNGAGSYASGTIAGSFTRSYHGLLIAACRPPLGRTLLVAKAVETVMCGGETYPLSTDRWQGGVVQPRGHRLIESFRLDGTIPTWRYAIADALLEKAIWMPPGMQATVLRYRWLRGSAPLVLELRLLVNHRSHHGGPVPRSLRVTPRTGGLTVCSAEHDGDVQSVHLLADRGFWQREDPARVLEGFALTREAERGLRDHDDHLDVASLRVVLDAVDAAVSLTVSLDPESCIDAERALRDRRDHERLLLQCWRAAKPSPGAVGPPWIEQLVLAADQFIVRRTFRRDGLPQEGSSIIAGYPWFGDWGRDTMISLAGLTLVTGRAAIAARILRTFAGHLQRGLLPNRFVGPGIPADHGSVDAPLWFFHAIDAYLTASADDGLLRDLYPDLVGVLHHLRRGTLHGIAMDPVDGLLRAAEARRALTWMDARVNGVAVTPRAGKPVEVNALWIHALRLMAGFARRLGQDAGDFEALAGRATGGFQRFWSEELGHCFDVLDAEDGNDGQDDGGPADPALRPNQLFAVSLGDSLLSPERERRIVDVCARRLLTSHGLRSLDPADGRYRGLYQGDVERRDHAYHQGTVWGWLIGPFALAHARVHGDPAAARAFLVPSGHHLATAGLGSISEIFDGDPPHAPRGCIAQAWSVAEVLRAWVALSRQMSGTEGRKASHPSDHRSPGSEQCAGPSDSPGGCP